jgi:hypothetical protein
MATQNISPPAKQGAGRDDRGPDKDEREGPVKLASDVTSADASPRDEDRTAEVQQRSAGFSETLKKWRADLVRFCRDRPLTALGVAFMLGRVSRRRRRAR